jgi:hypothetical protein
LQRRVNPTFMTLDEWKRKVSEGSTVVAKLNSQPKLFIIGSETDLAS